MQNISLSNFSFKSYDLLPAAQILLAAFSPLVLVSILTGLDPNVALFTAGIGTLVFQFITRGQVPVFLISSIAFIAPIQYGIQTWGVSGTLCGLVATGFFYIVFSLIINLYDINIIERLFPPQITGPIIILIGLTLIPVASNMALGKTGDASAQLIPENTALIISILSLAVTVLTSILREKILKFFSILCGICFGYFLSLYFGIIDFSKIYSASWFAIPNFIFPEWNFEAIIFIVPFMIVSSIEHFGDILAIGSVTDKNYLKKPGVHKTLISDGIATGISSFLGGPPNKISSEVTGAVAFTRSYNPGIMAWASVLAIIFSFSGKIGAFLQSIPVPVIGGILLLLFGIIIVTGFNHLLRLGQEISSARNMIIIAIMIAVGISGLNISFAVFSLKGVGLSAILGILLNLLLPHLSEKYPIGILVYGSMMGDPGKEINRHMLKKILTITPFSVEYARKSKNRSNAPVLVPVKKDGSPVKAQIIILNQDITEETARNFLYRRAINFVDEPAIVYSDKIKHENLGLEIQILNNFENVEKVFYTAFEPNIEIINRPKVSPDEKAKELAYLAIESVNQDTFCMQRDGIRCLIEDLASGVKTPLCDPFIREILNRTSGAIDLNEARLRVAKQKEIYPECHL